MCHKINKEKLTLIFLVQEPLQTRFYNNLKLNKAP